MRSVRPPDDYPLIETRSTDLARLLKICQGELFSSLPPLFGLASIRTVTQSLQHHICNQYISFLSDFFQNMIPATATITILAFGRFVPPGGGVLQWSVVDYEIQNAFFAAILAHTDVLHIAESQPRVNAAVALARLWASNLFWVNSDLGMASNIAGVEASCLRLLRESLQRYHTAADASVQVETMDTTSSDSSRKLLTEVEERLRPNDVHLEGHDLSAGDEIGGSSLGSSPTHPELIPGEDLEEIQFNNVALDVEIRKPWRI
ncbi:hypothetical protein MSAN_02055200 [Mycena sanguinolenta]|uniref:Uncharacterized protein n=1 Tax=Mycena sanguinolenta TaxID=230812 RepID=A0A8H6XJD3_9AGAR|nr:hypothetical protein MSAN_02055200 [Mycena sanguinolenta]